MGLIICMGAGDDEMVMRLDRYELPMTELSSHMIM